MNPTIDASCFARSSSGVGFSDALFPLLEKTIQKKGYCVVKNLAFNKDNIRPSLFSFLSNLGKLTAHQTNQSILSQAEDYFWDIKYRGSKYNTEHETTFSEQLGGCPLHSDSSFKDNPENYLVMYVVTPANDGGESVFLRSRDLFSELENNTEGRKCLDILNKNIYPFQTPISFDKDETIVFKPIVHLEKEIIRFRYDCIQKGIKQYQITSEMHWALNFFKDAINRTNKVTVFSANQGDLIIIDNLHGLHARLPFQDANRHYIRARIGKPCS